MPVLMQVKSKCREVQLHKDSPLGEAVLECYATGNRNVFSLGFVPVAGDNTVVLLARDTPANGPAVRDLGVDMSQVSVARANSCCRGYGMPTSTPAIVDWHECWPVPYEAGWL